MYQDQEVTDSEIDLSKPSMRALSYILRHEQTWPDNFKFNYYFCEKCAMGLAHLIWPTHIFEPTTKFVGPALGLSLDEARSTFLFGGSTRNSREPESVARELDSIRHRHEAVDTPAIE